MQSELGRNQPFASVVARVSKLDVYEVPVRFALVAGADRSAVHERRARGVFTEIRGRGRPDSPTIPELAGSAVDQSQRGYSADRNPRHPGRQPKPATPTPVGCGRREKSSIL